MQLSIRKLIDINTLIHMKKLLLVIGAALALTSCKPGSKTMLSPIDTTKVEESLNGVSILAADTMIADFIKTQDNSPNNTQVWFDKKVLDSIFTLFTADSLNGITKPDGIRIYLSRTPPTDSVRLHSNTGIILVSTYYAGSRIDPLTNQSIQIHSDYYAHTANAGLFKLSPLILSGTISHDTNDANGALLYDTCNCDSPFKRVSSHDISRSQAEKMAQSFHKQPFNAYSEWFDIAMFKHLKPYLDNNGDGFRIYFARGYNNGDGKTMMNKFVITTTRNNGSGVSGVIHEDNLTGSESTGTGAKKRGKTGSVTPSTAASSSTTSPGNGGGTPPPAQETGEDCPTHC